MPYKDPEKAKEYGRRRWQNNKESLSIKNKEYQQKNKEKIKKVKKAWAIKNPEKVIKYHRKWAQSSRGRFQAYTSGSKVRKIDFELTFNQFMNYWQKPCYYCGDEIKTIGLDRVDSSKGYILSNIVSCCDHCNYMKLEYTKDDFFSHCLKILKYQGIL